MSIKDSLTARSNNICELCGSTNHLDSCEVPPSDNSSDQFILICSTCNEQISDPTKMDENHWRCLRHSLKIKPFLLIHPPWHFLVGVKNARGRYRILCRLTFNLCSHFISKMQSTSRKGYFCVITCYYLRYF